MRAAMKNCGFTSVSRITVNLAPRTAKRGARSTTCPFWSGIPGRRGQLPARRRMRPYVGELSCQGRCGRWRDAAHGAGGPEAGLRTLYVPADSAPRLRWPGGMTVYPVEDVQALAAHLRGRPICPPAVWTPAPEDLDAPDLPTSRAREQVKRCLEIAAAGGHNLHGGPARVGQVMLARRLPSILPDLTRRGGPGGHRGPLGHGAYHPRTALLALRPFRRPTTISAMGMAGAAPAPRPGRSPGPQRRPLSGRAAGFHKDVLEACASLWRTGGCRSPGRRARRCSPPASCWYAP